MRENIRPTITNDQWDLIDKQLWEDGISNCGYVPEEKTVITDVVCPVCGRNIVFSALGNSREIYCETEGCLRRVLRGI